VDAGDSLPTVAGPADFEQERYSVPNLPFEIREVGAGDFNIYCRGRLPLPARSGVWEPRFTTDM
jgi:hypothetical protein